MCSVEMKDARKPKSPLLPDPAHCSSLDRANWAVLSSSNSQCSTELSSYNRATQFHWENISRSFAQEKEREKEIQVFYHGERCCSLLQQSHQTSFCEILSRTDTFFIWWHNIIRNCWLFQNIRRYVLRKHNTGKNLCSISMTFNTLKAWWFQSNPTMFKAAAVTCFLFHLLLKQQDTSAHGWADWSGPCVHSCVLVCFAQRCPA